MFVLGVLEVPDELELLPEELLLVAPEFKVLNKPLIPLVDDIIF
jgi:hypothetical protein